MPLISLLIGLLVICFVFWAARALLAAFSIGEPVATVIYIVLVLFLLVWLLGGYSPSLNLR